MPRPLAAVLLILLAAAPASRPADLPLNAAVLKFVTAQVGRTIGDGECTRLASEALRSAGAKRNRGYLWGRPLDKGEAPRPGDIVQFESCVFEGRDARHWWRVTMGLPHHTAVVKAVPGKTKLELLQQHPGPVNVATVDIRELKSGTYTVYRPVPREGP